MENPELKCPCCNTTLVVTHQDHYQDLIEHVSNPNGQPSLKDGYQCKNEECIAHLCNVAWIEDGECFWVKIPESISYQDLSNALKANHGNSYAVNSWNWHRQMGLDAIKKKSFIINLHWYKFKFEPKEKGWDYPIEVRHYPNLWKWKVEIWKREEYGSYVSKSPFWRMAKYCIDKFNREYKLWKENGNSSSLKECYNEAVGYTSWGTVDDRFYAKFVKVWLQVFKPNKVKEVIKAYNTK